MWPITLIVVYFILVSSYMIAGVEDIREVIADVRAEVRTSAVDALSEGVQEFALINNRFPADLDELENEPTLSYTRTHRLPAIEYARAVGLSDGPFTFERAAVAYLGRDNTRDGMTAGEFFDDTNNPCGPTDFFDSASWCGLLDAYWWRSETRWRTASTLEFERMSLIRTLQKFSTIYSASNPYEFPGAAEGMAPGDTQALSDLVGAPSTSVACSAADTTYSAWGHAFDCTDLFANTSGDPVYYTYVEASYVVLSTRTAFRNDAGERIVVSQEMIAE